MPAGRLFSWRDSPECYYEPENVKQCENDLMRLLVGGVSPPGQLCHDLVIVNLSTLTGDSREKYNFTLNGKIKGEKLLLLPF